MICHVGLHVERGLALEVLKIEVEGFMVVLSSLRHLRSEEESNQECHGFILWVCLA